MQLALPKGMTDDHIHTAKAAIVYAISACVFNWRCSRNCFCSNACLGIDDMTFFDLLKLDWLRTKIRHEMRIKFLKEYIRYRQRKFSHGEAMKMAEIVL